MDENKHPAQSQPSQPDSKEKPKVGQPGVQNGDRKAAVARTSRKILSKRYLYPALYLGAAAVIIGLMYIKTQTGSRPTATNATAVATTQAPAAMPKFAWPVAEGTEYKVSMGFFPAHGTPQQQAAAVVLYDNQYSPHQGIDIKSANGKSFDVTASAAGKVTAVTTSTQDPLHGNSVEVTSADGYVAEYSSLSAVNVQVGDTVGQGQVLGKSGSNQFEASQGDHLYFALSKDGAVVDPETVLAKP